MDFLKLQPSLASKFFKKQALPVDIKNSVAKLNIFYNEISFTALTENPAITWGSLIGDIGGQLG